MTGSDIDAIRERQREEVRRMRSATDMSLNRLAAAAGLAGSTLHRFMNKPVAHLLSARTMQSLRDAARNHSGMNGQSFTGFRMTAEERAETVVEFLTGSNTMPHTAAYMKAVIATAIKEAMEQAAAEAKGETT